MGVTPDLPGAIATASKASLAIFIRYFQIIDLINNFVLKLNLETPATIERLRTWLGELEFPKIGFLESLSLSNDGGKEKDDQYRESKENSSTSGDIFIKDLSNEDLESGSNT